jgi:hypothetical protein
MLLMVLIRCLVLSLLLVAVAAVVTLLVPLVALVAVAEQLAQEQVLVVQVTHHQQVQHKVLLVGLPLKEKQAEAAEAQAQLVPTMPQPLAVLVAQEHQTVFQVQR